MREGKLCTRRSLQKSVSRQTVLVFFVPAYCQCHCRFLLAIAISFCVNFRLRVIGFLYVDEKLPLPVFQDH